MFLAQAWSEVITDGNSLSRSLERLGADKMNSHDLFVTFTMCRAALSLLAPSANLSRRPVTSNANVTQDHCLEHLSPRHTLRSVELESSHY